MRLRRNWTSRTTWPTMAQPMISQSTLKSSRQKSPSVRVYLQLARAIGVERERGEAVARLPEVLDEVEKRGGKRKVVIFTESVRTQTYLAAVLSENGYAGQIVLLNGSNNDPGQPGDLQSLA